MQCIQDILQNFKVDKKQWKTIHLTGPQHDTERSKPGPYIKAAIEIALILGCKTVVEIGSTRLALSDRCIRYFDFSLDPYISPPCCNDGHSTQFLTRAGFDVHTVDIDPNCQIQNEWSYQNIKKEMPSNLHMHIPCDGIQFLQKFEGTIDFLYLDGWDVGSTHQAEKHLEAYEAAKHKFGPNHLILIDDTDFLTDEGGKDRLVSPRLIADGQTLLFHGRQTLFGKFSKS